MTGKKGEGPPSDAIADIAQSSAPDLPSSQPDVHAQQEWWPEQYQGETWDDWYDDSWHTEYEEDTAWSAFLVWETSSGESCSSYLGQAECQSSASAPGEILKATHCILDLGCTRAMGSRKAIEKLVGVASAYGLE